MKRRTDWVHWRTDEYTVNVKVDGVVERQVVRASIEISAALLAGLVQKAANNSSSKAKSGPFRVDVTRPEYRETGK